MWTPNANFEMKLEMAPRFNFDNYVMIDAEGRGFCGIEKSDNHVTSKALEHVLWQYGVLYDGEQPDETWWDMNFMLRRM